MGKNGNPGPEETKKRWERREISFTVAWMLMLDDSAKAPITLSDDVLGPIAAKNPLLNAWFSGALQWIWTTCNLPV